MPVLIFEQVTAVLIISFHREVQILPVIVGAQRILVTDQWPQIAGDRHPRIGRQIEETVTDQVHILIHPRIGSLQTKIFAKQPAQRNAWLDACIGFPVDIEKAQTDSSV